jgi:FAD/FMN-containing dehydrogenase
VNRSGTLSRRDFLRGAAGAVAGLSLAQLGWLSGCGDDSFRGNLDELEGELDGVLLRRGDAGFLEAALPWNRRYAATLPRGIARCLSVEDVRRSILWARQHDVPVVARSGGHSYAGFSTTTGLIIDVSLMNALSFESSSGVAVAAAGVRNADVYEALRAPSVAITHGRCRNVGVAGLVLGGGIGFNMRAHGLTCDQLVETQIVTAAGEILTCNAHENEDLYWACRGAGGGNFGIHTSFSFQTFPVGTITVFEIAWSAQPERVLTALQDAVVSGPDTLGSKVLASVRKVDGENRIEVSVLGQFTGSREDVKEIFAEAYGIAEPSLETIEPMGYWDGQEFLSENGDPTFVHERSRYAPGTLPDSGVETVFDFLRRWPGTSKSGAWKFFTVGGQVASVAPEETAYVHRSAAIVSSAEVEWSNSDPADTVARNRDWLGEFHEAMREFTSGQSYQNFIDEDESDWQRAYYGANLERLVDVKRAYDPDNFWQFAQSIPTKIAARAKWKAAA